MEDVQDGRVPRVFRPNFKGAEFCSNIDRELSIITTGLTGVRNVQQRWVCQCRHRDNVDSVRRRRCIIAIYSGLIPVGGDSRRNCQVESILWELGEGWKLHSALGNSGRIHLARNFEPDNTADPGETAGVCPQPVPRAVGALVAVVTRTVGAAHS